MVENWSIRKQLIEEIRTQLEWENLIKTLFVYGSNETELDLPWSDIDLVVEGTMGRDSGSVDYTLQMIKDSLSPRLIHNSTPTDFNWVKSISYFDRAAVPIIKMSCVYKGIKVVVDITHSTDQHKGLECIHLVKHYL
jgi:DNA polymerase sigma